MSQSKEKKNLFFNQNQKIPLLLAIIIIYAVHLFFNSILIPLKVRSVSMEPTINQNSRLFYSSLGMPNSVIPFTRNIPRGTLIVLSPPYHKPLPMILSWLNPLYRFITLNITDLNQHNYLGNNPYIVRRVIGIPGDTIYTENHITHIQPASDNNTEYFTSEFELMAQNYTIISNNKTIKQNWPKNLPLLGNTQKITLRHDEYFILSDNRNIGNDSSYWGPVHISNIRGQVLFQYIKKKTKQTD